MRLALGDETGMQVVDRECHRHGPSYSLDTLRELREEWGGNTPIAWMIGADAFAQLHTWHAWQDLFDLTHWVVMSRPGHALSSLDTLLAEACAARWTEDAALLQDQPAGRVYRMDGLEFPPSASAVRAAVAAGQSLRSLVPDAVADYIQRHGLYRGEAGPLPAPAV